MIRQFKSFLTRVGRYTSPKVVHNLNAVANYLAVGNWFKERGFEIGRRFRNRFELFDFAASQIAGEKVLYLEFGVWKGDATRYWSKLLKNPQSILHGFDSFEGLPEDWTYSAGKSHFSTQGEIPKIDDPRVKFFKGWFEESLTKYSMPTHDRLFINMDADLYSSSKFVLNFLKDHMKPGTFIYFDEFSDRFHEMKAFDEFLTETKLTFKLVGATTALSHVIFQRLE